MYTITKYEEPIGEGYWKNWLGFINEKEDIFDNDGDDVNDVERLVFAYDPEYDSAACGYYTNGPEHDYNMKYIDNAADFEESMRNYINSFKTCCNQPNRLQKVNQDSYIAFIEECINLVKTELG